MSMNSLREGFFQECEDLLEALTDGMTALETGAAGDETVNAIFRAVHSIKGGAAAFGLEALVGFAHIFENVLDAARAGKLALDGPVLDVCFRSSDVLADLVAAARDNEPSDPAASQALIRELDALLQPNERGATQDTPAAHAEEPAFTPLSAPLSLDLPQLDTDAPVVSPSSSAPADLAVFSSSRATPAFSAAADRGPLDQETVYCIRFAPTRETYATGNEPALLFRALSALGELNVQANLEGIPPLAELSFDQGYITWDIELRTKAAATKLHEVFEFVEGSCDLAISVRDPVGAALPEAPAFAQPATQAPGAVATDSAPQTPSQTQAQTPSRPPAPNVAVAPRQSAVADSDTGPAQPMRKRNDTDAPAPTGNRATIRVDLERVDRLINLVGELVINQAMLSQSVDEANLPSGNSIDSAMGQMRQLSSELQERVMAIRAQPVKPLFQRMSRIVRESGHASNKQARLVTTGETTEVDKTVIERLADPLTHMIRNAIDHGLEPPEVRSAAGKPTEGVVRLSAGHRSGRVVIELSDDGAGINRTRVHETAVKRGLITPDKELSDEEIDNLLFMPGFSTAKEISSLSGRGVGMDVVKSEIQQLGGRVTLSSTPGQGTAVTISLPLTLAVLEGMVVEAAGETLVVPTTALRETLKAAAADIQRIGARGWFISIRGGFVPIVDLGEVLGFGAGPQDFTGRVLLLIETGSGARSALAVDRVLDQREVVIKGLENNYGHVTGIAAATILGNGRIALIIDPDEIITIGPTGPAQSAEPALATSSGA